jgi:hypothetical protein
MMFADPSPLTDETAEVLHAPGSALLLPPRGAGEAQFNEAMRICPHAFLRSAIFSLAGKGKRKHFDDELLASTGDFTIRFTGLQLDQADLDVWLALVHLLQHQPVGSPVSTTHLDLLKMLGKSDSGQNRQALQRQLSRLRATAVSVRIGSGSSYLGGLIDAVEGGKTLVVRLDPRVIELFTGKRFARMRAAVRRELPPLSRWLYGYFSSHIEPAPVTVEELRRLCGSSAADLDDFRSALRNALKHLKRACDACEDNFNWRIDRTGLVHADWFGSQKHIRWSKKARARSRA